MKQGNNKPLRIFTDPGELADVSHPVITVGTYDGVHVGHRKILQRLCQIAQEIGGESVLVTFEPHPRLALKKDHENLRLLNTPDEKKELLKASCLNNLVIIHFTAGFSRLHDHEFIKQYLVDRFHVKRLVVGYDHRFGFNREGSFSTLHDIASDHDFGVEEISRQEIDDIAVSSTKIRNAVAAGDISLANKMLGYAYPLTGTVVKGEMLGRKIGFPTANLNVDYPYKLIPGRGVYAVRVRVNEKIFGGMCNIGTRPTFEGKKETIETYIFDFSGDIYGREIQLLFIQRLRDEMKFADAGMLIEQMEKDRTEAMEILQGNEK